MKITKTIAATISTLLIFQVSALAADFSDVPSNFWAKNEIDSFSSRGIVNGYQDGTFRPSQSVTREEFCKLLVSTFDQPLTSPTQPTFSDITPDSWSYPYIETCKDFLTGYANPFGGKPSYHPREAAQREDIAVALVRMMGYTDSEASNSSLRFFSDSNDISPNLKGYVGLACEKGLMKGYPDGSFRPKDGVTRAETVVLLERATKQAVTNIQSGLQLSANVRFSSDGKIATVHVTAEDGATVTVDGNAVRMSSGYSGWEGDYVYTFPAEGTKIFTITGTHAGKSKTIQLTASYELDAPILKITECPVSVRSHEVAISGTISDPGGGAELTINNETVAITTGPEKAWRKTYTLKEGTNTFKFSLTSNTGKVVNETRGIMFVVDAPVLKITNCPTSTASKEVSIDGTISDSNYGASLTINGETVASTTAGVEKPWHKSFPLNEGSNSFDFVLTNDAGKVIKETRIVELTSKLPTLKITSCPTNTGAKEVTLEGTISDTNYPAELTINGENVANTAGAEKFWKKTYTLMEGNNTFVFVLSNTVGGSVTETRIINFTTGEPLLKITSCPSNTSEDRVTIEGTISDPNYGAELMINGESAVNTAGEEKFWRKEVMLNEGVNTFEFVLTNEAGKSISETRTITLNVSAPEISFYNCPENSAWEAVTITGRVTGQGDVQLFVNNQLVELNAGGGFTYNVNLNPGSNPFEFRAVNGQGKEIVVNKTIMLESSEE